MLSGDRSLEHPCSLPAKGRVGSHVLSDRCGYRLRSLCVLRERVPARERKRIAPRGLALKRRCRRYPRLQRATAILTNSTAEFNARNPRNSTDFFQHSRLRSTVDIPKLHAPLKRALTPSARSVARLCRDPSRAATGWPYRRRLSSPGTRWTAWAWPQVFLRRVRQMK
jgi:hypothetical protein